MKPPRHFHVLYTVITLVAALLSPPLTRGQSVVESVSGDRSGITGAFEGWFENEDGTFSILVGYFNRGEPVDVPAGPSNRIDPGAPDRGQPTYFLSGRHWGVFTIVVPADFGTDKLSWTLSTRGEVTEIPFRLHSLWKISPNREATMGNTPPVVWFSRDGEPNQGPPKGFVHTMSATKGEPRTITVWTNDDGVIDPYRRERPGPSVLVSWSKFRGPGQVSFSTRRPVVRAMDGSSTTAVTFASPGSYVLRVQVNDKTREGGGGTQCCWTNALVRVEVSE